MKFKLKASLALAWLTAFSVFADESRPEIKSSGPPDKEKVSYALGMNIGLLQKRSEVNARTDSNLFIQAIKDVLDGKPTQLKESEVLPLLQRAGSEGLAAQSETDKQRISYAYGMRMAVQIKAKYADADGNVVGEGIRDVLEEKPAKMDQAEITPLLQQAMAWGKLKQSEKNKAEGGAFLVKNAKETGTKTLSDGLQYRVVKEGAGVIPTTNDMVYVRMKGTFVDGKQFIKHNHYLTRCGGGCQGWADALSRMKIGSRWQIFIPPNLGFGEEGEPAWGVGPEATMIFDLEMVAIAPPDAEFGRGRLGHAFEDSDIPDPPEEKTPAGSQSGK